MPAARAVRDLSPSLSFAHAWPSSTHVLGGWMASSIASGGEGIERREVDRSFGARPDDKRSYSARLDPYLTTASRYMHVTNIGFTFPMRT